ncbi:MAG TPA: PrsW family glutamic-type intramembrane protease [Ktedonobacteraceae bacterium]|nr:PrsW family glutamic-type intramembrane protease [Ktedonobacteraceae bacterium]
MSSNSQGSAPDPNQIQRQPTSELWGGSWGIPDEDTHPHAAISRSAQGGQQQQQIQQGQPLQPPPTAQQNSPHANFTHREHVTNALPAHASEAPLFRPAYSPYAPPQQRSGVPQPPPYLGPQGQQRQQAQYPIQAYPQYSGQPGNGYPGYAGYPAYPYAYAPYPGYPGYPGYPMYVPQKPRRDGYLFGMNIVTLVGAIIVSLGGLVLLAVTLIIAFNSQNTNLGPDKYFGTILQLIAFTCAGLIGGAFSLYVSIRALARRPSGNLRLPVFWIFLILYGVVIAISVGLQNSGNAVTNLPLSIFLIALAAIFPALALLAFGVRRLRFPTWPTTWRRFVVALTSGATAGIGLALVLELLAAFLLVKGMQASNALNCVNDPSTPGCGTTASFTITFIFVAILGPVIEETVKPLAVVAFIGRVRSASEAFVLGMACGIGFALIETVGYIGLGYTDWLTVALERTGASLLHGFGAGMVALGWYYLFHAKKYRFLKFLGCFAYAIFQHFVWNATALLSLLPGQAGSTINSWNLNLGFTVLPFPEILNILEVVLILVFFIYITGRIRGSATPPEPRQAQPVSNVPVLAHT